MTRIFNAIENLATALLLAVAGLAYLGRDK